MSSTEGPSIGRALRSDFRESTWKSRVLLLGVTFWLAYEWGPGNESVTPWLVARVIGTDNGSAAVVPTAAAVGFVFTLAQQLISGFTALGAFSSFPRTADACWQRLSDQGRKNVPRWSTMSVAARATIVFSLGTTAVALAEITTSGVVGTRRHARSVMESALLCALVVAAAAAAAGVLAYVGSRVPAASAATDAALRVLGNPLFWLGLVSLALFREYRSRRKALPVRTPAEGA